MSDDAFMLQQMELLREIRDEMRATRMQSGGGGGHGGAAAPASGGRSFSYAQSAVDRTLSGEWSQLGWSQAYRSSFKSTLLGDIAGSVGFARAPETLTQGEFAALSAQNVSAKLGSAALGYIAPHFNAQANALADEIYSHSGRFVRFGNQAAGVTGNGFELSAARQLSRSIGIEALSDMRLSQKDYGTITSIGMASGQFDQAGSAEGFKKTVRDLAEAVGSLTRTFHMSTSEVATAMGNLRQLGVTGVGAQAAMIHGAGASAMVAGMSAPEMLQMAGGVAQMGVGLGLGAGGAFQLGASNMALVRSMGQNGLVGGSTIAAGGGAQAIAQNISAAQMNFAASNAGMLSYMGGGGGGIGSMLRGLGRTAGTFEGMMTMDFDRVNNMAGASDTDIAGLMRGNIEQRLGMMGIGDTTSHTAQGAAYRIAQSMGLDASAARVYVNSNFTKAGRRNAALTSRDEFAAGQNRDRQNAYDEYLTSTSLYGQAMHGIKDMSTQLAMTVDAGMGVFEGSQGRGAGVPGWRMKGGLERDIAASMSGLSGSMSMGVGDILTGLAQGKMSEPGGEVRFRNPTNNMRKGAMLAGAVAAIGVATLVPGGLGLLGGLAATAGVTGTAYLSSMFGDEYQTFNGDKAKNIGTVAGLLHAGGSSVDAQNDINAGIFNGSAAFKRLTAKHDLSAATGDEFSAFSDAAIATAAETGKSVKEVLAAAKLAGVDIKDPRMVDFGGTGASVTKSQMAAMNSQFGDVSRQTNLARPENAAAVAAYYRAVGATGSSHVSAQIEAGLAKAGIAGKDFDRLQATVDATIRREGLRGEIAETAAGFEAVGNGVAQSEVHRQLGTATAFARKKLVGMGGAGSAALKELDSFKEDTDLFGALNGNGAFAAMAKSGGMGELFKDASSMNDKRFAGQIDSVAKMYHKTGAEAKAALQLDALTGGKANAEQAADAAAGNPILEATILKQATEVLERINRTYTGAAQTGDK